MATFEHFTWTAAPVGATNLAVTFSLLPGDLLVVVSNISSNAARSVTLGGTWGTWAGRQTFDSGNDYFFVDTKTGLTGTGTISITVGGSSASTYLWVVRGLAEPKVVSARIGGTAGIIASGTIYDVGVAQTLTPNQAVIDLDAVGSISGSTTVPAAGTVGTWVIDRIGVPASGTDYTGNVAAHIAGGDGVTPVKLRMSRNNTHYAYGITLLLGEPAANALVEQGSYVEVLRYGEPPLAVEGSYAETLSVQSSDLVAESSYLEALALTGPSKLVLPSSYVEALTPATLVLPSHDYIGWGLPMRIVDAVPAAMSTAWLWVRAKSLLHLADGAAVRAWGDLSAQNNPMAVAGGVPPTLVRSATPNGSPAVNFSGTSWFALGTDYMNSSDNYSGNNTLSAYGPRMLFDDTVGYWHSNTQGEAHWVSFRNRYPANPLLAYSITAEDATGPIAWDLQGAPSRLGPWTTLDSRSGQTPWVGGQRRDYVIAAPVPYAYYRLAIAAQAGYVRIREWGLDGAEPRTTGAQGRGDGELWLVVKTDALAGTITHGSWTFGDGESTGHYTYNGLVYENAGANTRRSFTPTMSVNSAYRIYRVRAQGSSWTTYLDGVQQYTVAGNAPIWPVALAYLGTSNTVTYTFRGRIAEAIGFSRALSPDEAAEVHAYLGREHFG